MKVSVDLKVQDGKKEMESLVKGKASLEACSIELNQCNSKLAKAKEIERKLTRQEKSQTAIGENRRVEIGKLKEKEQMPLRTSYMLNDEVDRLQGE